MRIESEAKNIKNGKVNINVHITHSDCIAVNEAHFEAILRAMHDTDEKAFDLAMMACITDFMGGCGDDCED